MAPQSSVPCKQPGPPWRLPWENNLVQAPGLSARLLALVFFFFFFSLGAVTFGDFGAASAKQVSGPQEGTALAPAPAYLTMGLLGNAVPVTEKQLLHRQGEALWVRDPEPAWKEGRASEEPAGFLGGLCLWPSSRHRHRCVKKKPEPGTLLFVCPVSDPFLPLQSSIHRKYLTGTASPGRRERRNGTIALDSAGFPAV